MKTRLLIFICILAKCTFGQFSCNRIAFVENNLFGLCDTNSTIIVNPIYTNIREFKSGKALVTLTKGVDNYYNFISYNGTKLFKNDLVNLPNEFFEGYATIFEEGKTAIIDTQGKTIISNKYYRVNSFYNNVATVACGFWKWGAINKKGEEIIPCIYDEIGPYFCDHLNKVKKDNKWALINDSGKVITKFEFEEIGDPFDNSISEYENRIIAKKNGKWGYINKVGKEQISFKYTFASDFINGIAVVKKNDKYGMIDTNEKVVIPMNYDDLSIRSDSLFPASKKGKYGFINKKNNVIIPFKYDLAYNFKEGKAFVCIDKKCGFIDKNNKIIIPFILSDETLLEFKDGLCWANYQGSWCYIDKNGKFHFK